jgi:hypothetical protein
MVSVAGIPSCPSLDHLNFIAMFCYTLESVSSAKYLGITLQSDLKWTQHANNIVANANKGLGFLKRNLKTSNTNIKSQAYLSLVRPKLEYACSVWNPHSQSLSHRAAASRSSWRLSQSFWDLIVL